MENLALDLFSSDLNIPELDGKTCARCGKIPEAPLVTRDSKGRFLSPSQYYIDRSSRMDCDAAQRNQATRLVTYHIKCWKEACDSYV